MPTARTVTAITRLKAALLADAELAQYVGSVTIMDRARQDELPPGLHRHMIVLVPGGKTASLLTPATNLERFQVAIRLVIAVWDPTDPEAIVIASDSSPGVDLATVGMLQFMEDVGNCLRKNELTALCHATAVECEQTPALYTVKNEQHDTTFYEETLIWTGEWQGYHETALRGA